MFFATGQDRILPRSFSVLSAVAMALRATPGIRRVSIEGHTDDVGNPDVNLDLSNRRAAAVLFWLVQHGVEDNRLEAHGFGGSRPRQLVTSYMNRREVTLARSLNRRVEFVIVDPSPAASDAPVPGQARSGSGTSPDSRKGNGP